jgi:UDP-glucose 4-epimerase
VPAGPVLVTGGAGYVGSLTVRLLQRLGVPVVVLDNLSRGHRAAVSAPLEVVDLGDRAALGALFQKHRPRSVVHFAALAYVGESVEDPARYYLSNVHYTWNLLEAMRAGGCREIVFSSTCATYGNPRRLPIDEEHPQLPISPYGRTKLHMEHMLADFGSAYGLHHAALRYFNAAGASSDGEVGESHVPETHLIPLVLQAAAGTREHVSVFGTDYPTEDGTAVRDYIHVEDLGRAHLLAMDAIEPGVHTIYNLGNGLGFSVRQVIEAARKVTGREIPVKEEPRRPGDPAQLVASSEKIRAELGWEPEKDLETMIADAWAWRQARPEGYSAS